MREQAGDRLEHRFDKALRIRVSQAMCERVDRLAADLDEPRSEVLREALRRGLLSMLGRRLPK